MSQLGKHLLGKKNCTLPRHVNIACIDVQRTMRNGCELVQYPVEVEVMSKGLLGYLGFGNLFEEDISPG